MSRQHINAYRRTLAEQQRITGSLNERVLRKAFAELLERTGRAHELVFTNEWEGRGPRGNHIAVDGALVPPILRKPFGYWEAKDTKDDLDREIAVKIASGYPDDNIIYEDTRTAVLRQDGREAMRVSMDDDGALLELLQRFYAYERPELTEFRAAAAKFRQDLPQVLEALRMAIGEAEARSFEFARALKEFLDHAREAINPTVSAEDVREMLIQHILTEEIFTSVFDNAQFHRENNVARKLGELEDKFFTGALRHATTELLRPYYGAIRHAASALADRREKQTFLKNLYEDFYKVYNPAAADRLGVVYTPGEIVRFMIRGAEWLTEKHWGKMLADEDVQILDPATGTGTFIVELLEHMEGAGPDGLRRKYLNELNANEVAILPYYVANLNIEATYAAISGQYAEFPGLVFVDTLDNTAGLGIYKGHQHEMFGGIADENLERVKRQNARKISVVIGNPPYRAHQKSDNDDNKNRPYRRIDKRIDDTYQKLSESQKTKYRDPYIRFLRWASDRISDEGVIAFVSNSSFWKRHSFDGVRRTLSREFNELWLIDLKGNARSSGTVRKQEGGNVFSDKIKVGVAIYFLVRRKDAGDFTIYHEEVADFLSSDEKIAELCVDLGERKFARIKPKPLSDWSEFAAGEPDERLPLAIKRKKKGKRKGAQRKSIFSSHSLGVSTNRDDWVYSRDSATLRKKLIFGLSVYNSVIRPVKQYPKTFKWSDTLRNRHTAGVKETFHPGSVVRAMYRPFDVRYLYRSALLIDRIGSAEEFFPTGKSNLAICFSDIGSRTDYCVMATEQVTDLHFGAAVDGYQQVARYRYTKSGERVDNITDWALRQFRTRYDDSSISKDDIFVYCYAALHDPVFREVHAADLRREFPSVPLHDDFGRWRDWGRALLDLHIGYEKVKPWKLERVDAPGKAKPVPKLKSDRGRGAVIVDSETQLTGIPPEAWDYRLGNRSAIDWVLDQHKEKKPRDPTVAAKFNTYRFADHKESMIKLLAKVVHVSIETVAITAAMRALGHNELSEETIGAP